MALLEQVEALENGQNVRINSWLFIERVDDTKTGKRHFNVVGERKPGAVTVGQSGHWSARAAVSQSKWFKGSKQDQYIVAKNDGVKMSDIYPT